MVITGLTRNQFVPKAHEGSNPSLCAKTKGLQSGVLSFSFGALRFIVEVPALSCYNIVTESVTKRRNV